MSGTASLIHAQGFLTAWYRQARRRGDESAAKALLAAWDLLEHLLGRC